VTLTVPPRVAVDFRVAGGVLGRYGVLAAGAVALGALHLRHRPATMCPFRALTGLPCPFCGGTTSASRLGHGDLRGALAASPLAVVMLGFWPLVSAISPPRWWRRRRLRITVIVLILIVAELWQLVRFGYL
jgi:Protein of unknown function (DUF2752)